MSDLRHELSAVARRWAVTLDPSAPRVSRSGVVAFGRDAVDRAVVLKLAAPESDEALGAAALRHYAGNGCVRVLAADGRATLLERVLPGESLAGLVETGDDDAATAQLCAVAALLHRAGMPHPAHAFPTVERWGLAFARYRASGATLLPEALVQRAAGRYTELAATQGQRCLLHGDLQHYNLLRDQHRGWLAIDPKGVIGEPAYEFGAMLRNPVEGPPERFADPAVVRRRVALIHQQLGLDHARLLGWGFAQCVLSAIWSWEDGASPELALRTARAIQTVLDGG